MRERGGASLVKREIEVPVDIPGCAEPVPMAGWLWAPAHPPGAVTVYCCLPGGGCTTDYFDLSVEGLPDYSMARFLAERGAVVVSLDHPGIGRSGRVPDIFALTPAVVSAASDAAYRQVLARLADGTALPGHGPVSSELAIGCGHSMGGMLAGVQQARFRTFDALVVMGAGSGLPTVLTAEESAYSDREAELREVISELARKRFAGGPRRARGGSPPGTFHAADVPASVVAAFAAQRTELIYPCGLHSMIPGSSATERAAIDVPMLQIFGDQDLEQRPHSSVAAYRSCPDLTLQVFADCGHCHNQASGRRQVWDRMAAWAAMMRASLSGAR